MAFGTPRRLWSGTGRALGVSRDGSTLAFVDMSAPVQRVLTMPAAGGEPRVLHTAPAGHNLFQAIWAADGGSLLVVSRPPEPESQPVSLLRVHLDTGAAELLMRRDLRNISVDPRGRSIVFIMAKPENEGTTYGVWSIDNLSSLATSR